jgi:hypothetical protein
MLHVAAKKQCHIGLQRHFVSPSVYTNNYIAVQEISIHTFNLLKFPDNIISGMIQVIRVTLFQKIRGHYALEKHQTAQ